MRKITNQSGMTLLELLIAMVIMLILSAAISDVMIRTTRLVLEQSHQEMSETNGKVLLTRIAEDVRMAYDTNISGGAGAFWDASSATSIFITKRENKDQYAVPSNGDNLWDVACYQWQAPLGVYGETTGSDIYVPGRILAGTDNGDSLCAASEMSILSDSNIDVLDFRVDYCRPANGVPGTYSCTNNVSEPGTMTTSSQCVWMVKLNVTTQRLPTLNYAEHRPDYPLAQYTTAVKPRNLYLMGLATDSDKNVVVDCCDANFVGTDVTWCPPPTKF